MKLSLKYKTAILLILIVIIGGGVATYVHINNRIQARFEEMKTRAFSMGQVIGLMFAEQLLTGQPVNTNLRIQIEVWLKEIPHARFLKVYNGAGEQIFGTELNSNKQPDYKLTARQFEKAMRTSQQQVVRLVTEENILDMLVPIKLFRTDFGLVRLGFDTAHFQKERNSIIYWNSLTGAFLILITFYIGNFFAGLIIDPISKLEETSQKFGTGNLNARANISTGDEIERLGDNFNMMADSLQERIEDLKTIQDLNRRISAQLRPEDLQDQIISILRETWRPRHIALLLFENDNTKLKLAAGLNVSIPHTWKRSNDFKLFNLLGSIDSWRRINNRNSLELLEPVLDFDEDEQLEEVVAFKLETNAHELGYLLLTQEERFSDEELNLLVIMSQQIKIALENAHHYMRAVTDELTGLYNRRFLDLQLKKESADPDAQPLSLLMIDIDDFKIYNDTYGHPAGDEVLEKLAKVFHHQVRTTDVKGTARKLDTVARYGGEEFTVILPKTNLENAIKVGERIRKAVQDIDHFEQQVTISLGAAVAKENEEPLSLLKRADSALYKAKKEGKNQICEAK
jgi:diguanylate cyclase (GGDEF)-like protein